MIKFSVITPFYNRKEFLSETILSVLNQDYPEFEYILVDDGSDDGAWELAEKFSKENPEIKLFKRSGDKKGASVCRNIGIKNASGQQIIFLDSDDLLSQNCLSNRAALIEKNSNHDFCVFPMLLFREKPDDMMILQNIMTDEPVLDRFLKRENVWLMSSVSWNLNFLKSINGFDEDCLSFQDWEINVRALLHSDNFLFFDRITPDNYYRQNSSGTISENRYSEEHFNTQLTMLKKIFLELMSSGKYSDSRKNYLAAFYMEVLNRYRILPMQIKVRMAILDRNIASAVECGLFNSKQAKKVRRFVKFNSSLIASRYKFAMSVNAFLYQTFILKDYFIIHNREQSKHKYVVR